MAKLPRGYAKWAQKKRSTYWATKRKARADLLNPQKPLAGSNLLGAAKAAVGIALDPQVSALDTQSRSTRIQTGAAASRAGNYYKNLAASVQGDVTRSQALTGTLAGKLGTIAAEGQAATDRAQGVADATQAVDVGIRGPGLAGGGDERVRAELAAQRANQATASQAAQETGANIGANWEGYLRQMGAAQQMRGGEAQQQLLNRMTNELGDIRTKKSVLQAQRGPMVLEQLTKLRQQAFENAATASALGEKKLALKYQAQSDAADRQLARVKIQSAEEMNKARVGATLSGQQVTLAGQGVTRAGQVTTARQRELDRRARVRTQREAERGRNRRAGLTKKGGAAAKMPKPALDALSAIGNIKAEYDNRQGESLHKIADDLRKNKKLPPLLVNLGSALATREKLRRQGKWKGRLLTPRDRTLLKGAYPGITIPKGW
jgi:hypothetical protein